jgi:hypothetical protein
MSQNTEIPDEDYEYDYSENEDDDEAGMDIDDEEDELVSPTHKKAKHNQKSPSITPRNSDSHAHGSLLDSLDMSTLLISTIFPCYNFQQGS